VAKDGASRDRNRTLPLYVVAVIAVLVLTIALASYQVELGIAKPGASARRVAVAAAEIDATLEGDADFVEFSESLYAALVAHRAIAIYNAADNRVDHTVGEAIDCYEAYREAWQAEREGTWDPEVQGDPAYWRSFHPAVKIDEAGPLDPPAVREALRREALAYADAALSIVER